MPQHWVGQSRVTLLRALAVISALVLVAGFARADIAIEPDRHASQSAIAAARLALDEIEAGDPAAAVAEPFHGTDDWQTGTLALPVDDVAGYHEPRIFLYVAKRESNGWRAAVEGTDRFPALSAEARTALAGTSSADLLETTVVATSSGNGSAQLSLPWKKGKTWRLTGGPHHFNGGRKRPWSSIDFAGPTPGTSVKVRAAGGGIVVRPCRNLVQIRHGDGWATSYYHLKYIAVKKGQSVARGQFLGYTSNRAGCGGSSTGPHVHFSLLKSGSFVNIRGHTIGGWTVKEGGEPYEGCMVKDGVRRCAPSGKIYNDGSIGTSTNTLDTQLQSSTAAILAQ